MTTQRVLIGMLSLFFLAACGSRDAGPGVAEMTMQVHTVPPERAEELRDRLNYVLSASEDSRLGKVSVSAQGQLLVLAPARLQPSIEASLKDILTASPQQSGLTKVLPQLQFKLWSVDAISGAGTDSEGLEEIEPALQELRSSAGAAHFVLRDRSESVSMPGEEVYRNWHSNPTRAMLDEYAQRLQYTISDEARGRVLRVDFNDRNYPPPRTPDGLELGTPVGTALRTVVKVAEGQILVIGSQPVVAAGDAGLSSTRYYIVRIDEIGAD